MINGLRASLVAQWLKKKKSRPANAGDVVSLDKEKLQYSCLGNPMDRGAWQATVHVVTKSLTQLSD